MKKRFSYVSIIAFVFLLFSSINAQASTEFIIFHTSDTHGTVVPHLDKTSDSIEKPLIGGFAALKSVMNQYKANPRYKDARFLYFDCGDLFQGTPIVDRTKGGVMIDLMNQIGLTAVTFGNHEFDYTYEMMLEQMECAKFPIVCCNVFDKKTRRPVKVTKPYCIYKVGDKKIGIIGYTAPETASITFEDNVKSIYFEDPTELVKPIIKTLRKAKVDMIIALSHIGINNDIEMMKHVEGIDLVLGGHSHTLKKDLVYAGPHNTPIVHSGANFENNSVIHVTLDDTNNISVSMESVPLYVDKVGQEPKIKAASDEYLEELNKEMSRVIGQSEVSLYRGLAGIDAPAGTFMSQAVKHCSNADIAFTNFGGIRNPLLKGQITVESIFLMQPFANCIETIDMTGAELLDVIEHMLSVKTKEITPEDNEVSVKQARMDVSGTCLEVGNDYGFLYPYGIKITFDPSKEPMKRIVSVVTEKDNKPIDTKKIYKVAFSDFIANGGDGYAILKNFKTHNKSDMLIRDAMFKYIGDLGVIKNKPPQTIFNTKAHLRDLDL